MDEFIGREGLITPQRMRALTPRSNLRGTFQTASHFGAILATGTGLLLTWGSWWAVPFFILHGMLINYLYAAQHELSHNTVFKARYLNELFGRIIGFLLIFPRTWDQQFHFAHHRHTQDWEKDPELLIRAPYTMGSYLLHLTGVSYWYGRVRRTVLTALGQFDAWWLAEKRRPEMIREARWHLLG